MSQDLFKAPKAKRPHARRDSEGWSPSRKKKIKTEFDFLSFCDIVLQYTKYESTQQDDLRKNSTSPLDSGGSTAESFSSESTSSSFADDDHRLELATSRVATSRVPTITFPGSNTPNPIGSDDDDDNSITCFCQKPYGGRPMIQCDPCQRWIHYSCAKIRKNKIPDIYVCQQCKDSKAAKRKSNRMSMSPSQTSSPST